MSLLSLPYDLRHQIYKHLFPPGPQIYIQVLGTRLRPITPEHKIPTELLLISRAFTIEASEFLYNSYLFNIIGTKRDCLAAYEAFVSTVKKHARDEVHVDAFSNGTHSSTMCLSVQAGEGRMGLLKRRERGQPKEISELEDEVGMAARTKESPPWSTIARVFSLRRRAHLILAACCALLAMTAAWLIN